MDGDKIKIENVSEDDDVDVENVSTDDRTDGPDELMGEPDPEASKSHEIPPSIHGIMGTPTSLSILTQVAAERFHLEQLSEPVKQSPKDALLSSKYKSETETRTSAPEPIPGTSKSFDMIEAIPGTSKSFEMKQLPELETLSMEDPAPSTSKSLAPIPFSQRMNSEEYLRRFDRFEQRKQYPLLINSIVPEKIILVLDRAQGSTNTDFVSGDLHYSPMTMLKTCLQVFVQLKLQGRNDHEVALVLLNETDALWVLDFTNDIDEIYEAIENVTECNAEDTLDMNVVFEEILANLDSEDDVISYIIRPILFYSRSNTLPLISFSEDVQNLLEKSYFICDLVMTHDPPEKDSICDVIFECLQGMDKKGLSYVFPVGRSIPRLHSALAKLLMHSFHRPIQKCPKI